MTDTQHHGFRKGEFATTASADFTDVLLKATNNKQKVVGIFIEY